jgi:hypothetical protein
MTKLLAKLSRYEMMHLPAHLRAAGNIAALDKLLRLETDDHQNAWSAAKEEQDQVISLLADAALAIELAETLPLADREDVGHPTALRVRYTLFIASVKSRTHQVPAQLARALVEKGVWSIDRAWSNWRLLKSWSERLPLLRTLLPLLPKELVREAVELWKSSRQDREAWENAIVLLAGWLPSSLLIVTFEEMSLDLTDTAGRELLARLVPYLPPPYIEEMIGREEWRHDLECLIRAGANYIGEAALPNAIFTLAHCYRPEEALAAIAPRLSLPLVEQGLAICRASTHSGSREFSRALRALLVQMARLGRIDAALQVMRGFGDGALALPELASVIAERGSPARALTLLKKVRNSATLSRGIVMIASHLRGRVLDRALETARAIWTERERADALCALAERYPPHQAVGLLGEALAAAKTIHMRPYGGDASAKMSAIESLSEIASLLARFGGFEAALSAVEAAGEEARHADHKEQERCVEMAEMAFGAVAKYLPEPELRRLLGLRTVLRLSAPKAMSCIAPYLSPTLVQEACETATAKEIVALAPVLPESVLRKALFEMRERLIFDYRAEFIDGLAPYLAKPLLQDAVRFAQTQHDLQGQVVALASLSRFVPASLRREVLTLVMEQVRSDFPSEGRSQTLVDIAEYLTLDSVREALAVAGQRSYDFQKDRSSAALLVQLGRLGHLDEAVEQARALGPTTRAEVLSSLMPLLAGRLVRDLPEALAWDGSDQAAFRLLEVLGPKMSEVDSRRFLGFIQELGGEDLRMRLLVSFSDGAHKSVHSKILRMARASALPHLKAQVLLKLLGRLPTARRSAVLDEAMAAVGIAGDIDMRTQEDRGNALALVLTRAPPEAAKGVLALVKNLDEQYAKEEILRRLAPHLSRELIDEALAIANQLDYSSAGRALGRLVAQLVRHNRAQEALERLYRVTDRDLPECLGALAGCGAGAVPAVLERIDWMRSGEAKAAAVCAVAPHLPQAFLPRALTLALTIENKFHRIAPLKAVVAGLEPMPPIDLRHILGHALDDATARSRFDFLYDLAALAPLVARLGGAVAVKGVCAAIQQAHRWWP